MEIFDLIQPGHFNNIGERQKSLRLNANGMIPGLKFDRSIGRLTHQGSIDGDNSVRSGLGSDQQFARPFTHPQPNSH